MVKETQTIRWLLRTNCWTVFDHFVRLALIGLMWESYMMILEFITIIWLLTEIYSCT